MAKTAQIAVEGTLSAMPDSISSELEALRSGCGVYELASRCKIRLNGTDRMRWLNGMVTNNVRDLALNHGVYSFLLNAQGHIQADLYAYNLGESLLVDAPAELREKVLASFDKFIIMDDVEVVDETSNLAAIGVGGPKAREVLLRAGIQLPELDFLEACTPSCDCKCACLKCTVVRGDEANGGHYELWLSPQQMKAAREALISAGAVPVSAEAVEIYRIGRGIPRYGADICERDLPQETGQTRALNFAKGCYLGQEIVERIRSRGAVHRAFGGFAVNGPLPPPGTKIQADGKDVGEVTSSVDLALREGKRSIALGYLRREAAGKELQAGESVLQSTAMPVI